MADMATHAYEDWLERYRQAWIARDADLAGSLFTEDGTYREQPFQLAFSGRAAIQDYWRTVTASQTNVELRYGTAIVHGRRLAVEWWANLETTGGPLTLAGEFMLRFAASGECEELREYWVLTQGRAEPPLGWGA